MIDFRKPFLLISAERPGLEQVEIARRNEALQTLARVNGYNTLSTFGIWEGERETSFIIYGNPKPHGHSLFDLGHMFRAAYNQDAFIVYDGTFAHLFDRAGNRTNLGRVSNNIEEAYTELPNGERFCFK